MRVTVVGAGAIGGVVGVFLQRAGHEVMLVDRDAAHVAAVRDPGLRIDGTVDLVEKMHAITPDQLADYVRDAGKLGMVVLATKAMDTESATRQIAPFLADDGFILSYQNGLNEETISGIVGPRRTVGAFIHFGSDLIEPGHLRLGYTVPTYISELDKRHGERIRMIADVMSAVTPVEITDSLEGYLWGKLCYAALAFAVSNVDAPIDEVITKPIARIAIRGVCAEVDDVGHAQGYRLENIHGFDPNLFDRHNPNRIAETNAYLDRWAEEGRTAIKRHMGIHRDIKYKHRRTEVDFHVGPVVEHGKRLGVPTPLCAQLVEITHEVESSRRPQDWSTIEELGAAARAFTD